MLKDGSLPDAQREQYVEHLAASADLLSGLLDDVLDMSKIEAGEMTLEHIPYGVHEVLQQAFAAFCWRGEEKGLHMDAAFDPAVPARVHGDPVRVRQIVLNYLSNAVKFTVDDNAVNRLVAAAMLERSGARVVEAHDGFEAIELVRRRGATLDLVLMDLYCRAATASKRRARSIAWSTRPACRSSRSRPRCSTANARRRVRSA